MQHPNAKLLLLHPTRRSALLLGFFGRWEGFSGDFYESVCTFPLESQIHQCPGQTLQLCSSLDQAVLFIDFSVSHSWESSSRGIRD